MPQLTVADVRRMLRGEPPRVQEADLELPITVETVVEAPMRTVETVEIVLPVEELTQKVSKRETRAHKRSGRRSSTTGVAP